MNGIDIRNQKARMFVPEDFERFDKIYALANDVVHDIKLIAKNRFDQSKIDLLLNELYPGENMDVPDPWYGTEEGFHRAYKLISAACEKIIEKAQGTKNKQAATPSDRVIRADSNKQE